MNDDEDDLELPRDGIAPDPDRIALMECFTCGTIFPRHDVKSVEKGTLRCPACDAENVWNVD
ncbi:hypothetical protein [Halomarina ordinaria]|uniref:Zinc ribbon domain-containing protein n=1 Tax=Halomarina ordinaria TaxID=3033939 RepID=A0ABD5U5N1_9EURY|nr:hypothetical protein [Halomarina sp. PSRA2]